MPAFKGQIPRTHRINDDGSRTRGTPLNDQELQAQYDAIETVTYSGNFPDVALNSLLDNIMAGIPFAFGGSSDVAVSDVAYPAGAAIAVLAPGTRPLSLNGAHVTQGTYRIQGIVSTEDAAHTATLGLFNLTDAPDAPLVEISTNVVGGELKESVPITFAIPGAAKLYGLKLRTSDGAGFAKAWGVRLVRTE